jgi:pimeloyl-ACP methyl ester carboxylesterase
MGEMVRADVTIAYDDHPGAEPPVLLIAPGGLRSEVGRWSGAPYNPIAELGGSRRLIAMDQRNAGRSSGPLGTGWATYTGDQLALLDRLGVDRFFVLGMCIGGSYIMGLARAAPKRICGAVMLQPIGLDANREVFYQLADGWRDEIAEVDDAAWASFREAMFGGDFLFSASRDDVAACPVPLLLFRGDDVYHPTSISDEIAELAPDVRYVKSWKEPEDLPATRAAITEFLEEHAA